MRCIPPKIWIAGLALASFLLLVLVPGAGAAPPQGPHDLSTILVKFAVPAKADTAISAAGDRHVADTGTHVAVVRIDPRRTVSEKVAEYSARPGVVYAEPNFIARASVSAPNDPSYSSQWAYGKIQAVAGWTVYPGSYASSGGATLAVVDTGVEAAHPDLAGRVTTSAGATCLTGTCVAGPGTDDNGHGTHVAGIAGAATNNATGVAGTAFSSPIVPVKVLDSTGSGTYASVASGIIWAAQHGARVMNLSLGGSGYSQTLCNAVTTATNTYHVLVVAAAGNSATSAASYPAACPGALGVAATDSNDAPASFTNFGKSNVFVSAPGVNILSTYMGGTYRSLSGTSMATPFVTGLSALLVGQNSALTPAGIKLRLAQNSDKVGTLTYGADPLGTCAGCTWNDHYGYGRINVYRALSAGGAPNPDFALSASPATATVVQGKSTTYAVSIAPQNGFTGSVSLSASGLPAGAQATFAPNPTSATSTMTVTTSATTPAATSTVTIRGTSGGLSHTTTVQLTVQAAPNFSLSATPSTATVTQGAPAVYTVAIAGSNGFNGSVTLTATGLPAGAAATFSPNPATTSSTMTVTTSASTPAGTSTVTISGTSGALTHTTTVQLTVQQPASVADFGLSASPTSLRIDLGDSGTSAITVVPSGGFSGAVTFSATGLPSGVSPSFNPNPSTGSTTLTLTTSVMAHLGTYTVTIVGTSGTLTHSTALTLVISYNFALSASPASQTVAPGAATSYTIAITRYGGFLGPLNLTASGLPAGATASYAPNATTGNSSVLTVTTSSTTPTGTYTITTTGVGGDRGLTHTTTVTLVVA